jgi:imidazolonepropionase-like amidohydrolase
MDDDMGWCRDPLPRLPKIPADVRTALISEARRLGLRVSVHAPDLADATDAVADGATVLAHGILDAPVGDDLARRMHDAHVFYVPTLDIFDFLADPRAFVSRVLSDSRIRDSIPGKTLLRYRSDAYFDAYRKRYPNAAFVSRQLPVLYANAAKLKAAGVEVALGTDMWAFPGAGMHVELEDFVKAGWTPLEAIRAATLVSARSLGADADRGTIETGKRADFVVLENDPLRDIRNTRSIERVFKAGRVAWSRYRNETGEE